MRRVLASVGVATLAIAAFAGTALGHTGSVAATQDCSGYTVTVTLNSDVTEGATFVVDLEGTVIGQGTGPGPATFTFTGPVSSGTVTLTLTFDSEKNVYTATLPSVGECPTPTPPPSHAPPTHRPSVTPPPTSTDQPQPSGDATPTVLLLFGGVITFSAVLLYLSRTRNSRWPR